MLYDRRDCTNFTDADDEPVTTKWSREYSKELDRRKVVWQKQIDPKHPYCTNWPNTEKLDNKE